MDDTYFADFFRTGCRVALDSFSATSLRGSFRCTALSNGAGTQKVDVQGAFSAVK